jgi:tRNA A37 threonylcarbamoyladenosine dehydratase
MRAAASLGRWPLASAARSYVLRRTVVTTASLVPRYLAAPTAARHRLACRRPPTAARRALTASAASADAAATDNADDWQQRSRLLFEARGLDALRRTRVLVVGLGGVGSYAAEALARAGVGHLTIVDGDDVDTTNRNRQLIALRSTVGRPKVEVLAERLLDVNPRLELKALQQFLDPDAAEALVAAAAEEDAEKDKDPRPPPPPKPRYDYVLDCIDSLAPKVALIAAAARAGSRVVASMGAGGRVDPSRVRLVDAAHTQGDALGRSVRKGLKRAGVLLHGEKQDEEKGPPPTRRLLLFRAKPGAIACVFSDEPARRASLQESRSPANPYKASYFGTASYVPAAFGLVAASAVIRQVADGATARELLWVPPAAKAADERAKKEKRKRRQVAAAAEQRRKEERDAADRLRAWAEQALGGGPGADGGGI